MISFPIIMDGITYPTLHVTKLTRTFSILDGENAGRAIRAELREPERGAPHGGVSDEALRAGAAAP